MLGTLYPTDTSAPLYAAGDVELTQYIQNIAGITLGDDFAKPYYMGYLPQDSFPESVFGITAPRLSADQKTLYLNNFVKENRPWGYCWFYEYGSNYIEASFQAYYFNSSNQLTRYRTNNWANVRLVNKITMANVSLQDKISLTMKFRIVPTANLDENGTGRAVQTVNYTETTNLEGLRKFVNGQTSFTCTISQSYVSTTKVLNYSDFDENTMTCHYTDGDYEVYVILFSFSISNGQLYKKHNETGASEINILPFYRTHVPEGVGIPEQDAFVVGYNYGDIAYDCRYQTSSDSDELFMQDSPGIPYCYCSYMGVITSHFYRAKYPLDSINMSDVPFLTGSGSGIIKNCMFIDAASGTGKTFTFCPCMDFKDVLKTVMLRNCVQTNHSEYNSLTLQDTYDSDMYVSYFNGDDIPYFDNMPITLWGAVGNSALDSGILRPWQEPGNDITVNAFDVDDMPEYNPPGPEPSDWGEDRYGSVPGLWLGSDGITANFITPWVLRGSQVTNFGQFLWENLFLPDPDDPSVINGLWNNFLDALGSYWQTGSFDPASTLDFVISLLYFPFKLDTLSSDSGSKKLYFGTGALGLTVSASYNTRRLTAYHGYLNGGNLDLNDPSVKSALGIPDDFRGLANTSACIYLPFCGTYQVNWADIKDSSLSITYAIDFTTGACTAYVLSAKNGKSTYVLTASGMIGFSVPLSATNANRLISSILGDVAKSGAKFMDMGSNIGTKIMTAGQTDKPSQTGGDSEDDLGNTLTLTASGGLVGSAVGSFTMAGKTTKELFAKPSIGIPTMSGGSGWNALHCPRTPFLQVRTPQFAPDGGHGHAFGWPAEKQMTISALPKPSTRNYYECINVDTSTLSCTHEERQMIKNQLESGFYIRA